MTDRHPYYEFEKDTYEIDEFDCSSIFLFVGKERALLLDTGCGIGDLKGVIRKITDKPVSYTHLRAHETRHDLVCRLLLEKKKKKEKEKKKKKK